MVLTMTIVAFVAIVLLLIAGTVDGCFAVLPAEFRKVPPKMIWAIMTAFVLYLTALILAQKMPGPAAFALLAGFAIFFVVRGISFIGLSLSFRSYARERNVHVALTGPLLAGLASTLDFVAVIGLFIGIEVARIKMNFANQRDTIKEIEFCVFMMHVAMAAGLLPTIAFLLTMSSDKNNVLAHQRAERKKKLDEMKKKPDTNIAKTSPWCG
ncbi:MAG TPA: hypothetical protein VKX17_14445 [Planctomycetota bacterium]|nr:hypothetical protein [Planctomycetota bacterium]